MPGPLPPNPVTPVEAAAQDAVAAGTQTSRAQTVAGTIQTVTQTTPGALTTTVAHNGAFATINNVTTGAPETTALAWLVTFWWRGFEATKIDQDRLKWFLLPFIAILVGFFTWWAITPNHDPLFALGKAVENAGSMAANALANFQTTKPLGWFGGPAEVAPAPVIGSGGG